MTLAWRVPFHVEDYRARGRVHLIDMSKWLTTMLCQRGKIVNSRLATRADELLECEHCKKAALQQGFVVSRFRAPAEEMSLSEMAKDENRYLNRQQAKENNK